MNCSGSRAPGGRPMHNQDVFLERALVEDRLASAEQIARARRYGQDHDVDLVDALVKLEIVSGRDIALTRANVCETPFVAVDEYETCFANTQILPRAIAERYCAFPLFMID